MDYFIRAMKYKIPWIIGDGYICVNATENGVSIYSSSRYDGGRSQELVFSTPQGIEKTLLVFQEGIDSDYIYDGGGANNGEINEIIDCETADSICNTLLIEDRIYDGGGANNGEINE